MAKKILNEATIRRFMKLASIDKLSESYFDEIKEEEEQVEESKDEEVNESEDETVEESVEETNEGYDEDKEEMDEEVSISEEEDEEMGGEMDMDAAEEPAGEAPAAEADVAAALKTIADALGAAGIDIEVSDSEDEMEDEMDMGDAAAEEPEMAESKSAVLPLHHRAIGYYTIFVGLVK